MSTGPHCFDVDDVAKIGACCCKGGIKAFHVTYLKSKSSFGCQFHKFVGIV
jgi:hypothetical protein